MGTKSKPTWARCVGWSGCLLLLALAGCGPTLEQDRLHDIAEDGVALFHRGQYQDARESFEVALKAKPNDANLLFNTGQCYDRLGNRARRRRIINNVWCRTPSTFNAGRPWPSC